MNDLWDWAIIGACLFAGYWVASFLLRKFEKGSESSKQDRQSKSEGEKAATTQPRYDLGMKY